MNGHCPLGHALMRTGAQPKRRHRTSAVGRAARRPRRRARLRATVSRAARQWNAMDSERAFAKVGKR